METTQKYVVSAKCPHCNTNLDIECNVPGGGLPIPKVRCGLVPEGAAFIYKINSDQIKAFVLEKARKYAPGVQLEMVSCYTEKKNQKEFEPRHSYCSLRIAFSHEVLKSKGEEADFFTNIGEANRCNCVETVFANIIQKYGYDKDQVAKWMDNYKTLDKLEDALGITEEFLTDLRQYITPRKVKSDDSSDWIIFSAAPEKIIIDMLTDYEKGCTPGKIMINSLKPITADNIEFTVYVYPMQAQYRENPNVRKILLGNKGKK